MPIETPPPITPVPTPVPQRGDRATFSDRVDAFVTWLEDAPPEFEAVADNVENNATMAQTFATNASNSATAASTSASNAATSATNAATSATSASGFASAAATSATNAATSESNAAASAAAAAAMAAAFTGTSSTSVTIGTGAKTFTTQTGEQYTTGVTLSLVSQANVANFMIGQVTGYNSGTGQLNMNITVTGGSGTFADWNISLAGVQGPIGPQGPAGNLSGGNLTGALNELKAANIAAAATTNVWDLVGNSATLTGTTTITSFGTAPQAGSKRTLIAAAATPITNGASLILPGSANYTCSVGDRLEIYAETTTQHRVAIWKANGASVGGSPMPRSARASNVAFIAGDSGSLIEFTAGFTQTYSAGSSLGTGWWIIAKNTSGADVTHDPNGSETIDEVTSGIQKSGMDLLIEWDGTKFNVVRLDNTRITEVKTNGTSGTLPLGVRSFKTRQSGAGGSGAKSSGATPAGAASAAGYSEKTWTVTPSIKTYSFSLGAAGTSQTTANTAGVAGGATTFTYNSVTVTTNGGAGGSTSVAVDGGTATGGDLNLPGGQGTISPASVAGTNPLGVNRMSGSGLTPQTAEGFGTGGVGATSSQNSAAGAPSVVFVEY